jgi:hypothetical protein
MNERIEYLALLARQHAGELHPNNLDTENWAKVYHEKFAELIVQEMLQTCEDHPAWTGRMIGEQIKQHFGVEE